jgi:hypothetical protein
MSSLHRMSQDLAHSCLRLRATGTEATGTKLPPVIAWEHNSRTYPQRPRPSGVRNSLGPACASFLAS